MELTPHLHFLYISSESGHALVHPTWSRRPFAFTAFSSPFSPLLPSSLPSSLFSPLSRSFHPLSHHGGDGDGGRTIIYQRRRRRSRGCNVDGGCHRLPPVQGCSLAQHQGCVASKISHRNLSWAALSVVRKAPLSLSPRSTA